MIVVRRQNLRVQYVHSTDPHREGERDWYAISHRPTLQSGLYDESRPIVLAWVIFQVHALTPMRNVQYVYGAYLFVAKAAFRWTLCKQSSVTRRIWRLYVML